MFKWLVGAVLITVGLSVQLNYTFYYEYEFPPPDCLHVTLLSYQKGRNLTELVENVRETWRTLREVAERYNATLVGEDLDEESVAIQWSTNYEVEKSITIQVKEDQIVQLLDQIQGMSVQYGFYIDMVEEALSQKQDLEYHTDIARGQAELRSKQICKKYFNMELKSMALFEQYVEKDANIQQQDDQVVEQADESNQTESVFIGNLQQVIEQKLQQEADFKIILENAIYKCQIICQGRAHPPKKAKTPKIPKKPSPRKAKKLSTLRDRFNSEL